MESDGGEREEWWTVMNGGRGVGWGLMKGEGVLLGRRHPCARSSSVCALVVCVRARCPSGRSSSVCALVVLSMGVRYAWVARRRCLREARRRLGVGVVGCGPWVVFLFVGRGRRWWVWGVVHGHCVVVVGTGLLFVGTGLPIVGGGARSHGQVVHVCWFVVCGRSGDVRLLCGRC